MGEIWAAAAVTVVGGAIAGRGAQKEKEGDQRHDKEMTRESARWNAELSSFERQQEDYYQQMNRRRKQRGLDNFRQFSRVSNFAPQYQQSSGVVEVGEKPVAAEVFKEPEQNNVARGGRSTLSKIVDPLGLF